jgi:prolyl-tRNA editing enzyme YbaK/EbsC (Cys-tRNA(Pro) deacylase)
VTQDTPAIRAVAASGASFGVVRTERPSSAEESAAFQGIEVNQLIRTIVVRRGAGDYVFVLVPGGRQIDWPLLRAHLGASRLSLPDQEEAKEATGYERGTITPFASAKGCSHQSVVDPVRGVVHDRLPALLDLFPTHALEDLADVKRDAHPAAFGLETVPLMRAPVSELEAPSEHRWPDEWCQQVVASGDLDVSILWLMELRHLDSPSIRRAR